MPFIQKMNDLYQLVLITIYKKNKRQKINQGIGLQIQKLSSQMNQPPQQSIRSSFFQKLNNFFQPIDQKLGPSRMKYKPGCDQDKQMFLECILSSPCYKQSKQFKYCAQEGVTKQCKAIRYDYYLCKRSMIFWNKAFVQDDPRKV